MGCNDTGGADHVEGLLWAGFAGMAFPAFYFASQTLMVPEGKRKFHVITTFICMIASLAYLTMATGNGVYLRPFDCRAFLYARYIDWFFTTPLQLLDLLGFAGAGPNTTNFLIGVDILMIVAGLIGAFFEGSEKYLFWAFGMLCFFPIVYYLQNLKGTAPAETAGLYGKIANLTIVTWSFYPLVWVLAEGSDTINADTEAALYTLLDVLAKSVFGFIIISARGDEKGGIPAANGAL